MNRTVEVLQCGGLMQDPFVDIVIRRVYGVDKFYPANINAELFAQLVNKKTLSQYDVQVISKLGYQVRAVLRNNPDWRDVK